MHSILGFSRTYEADDPIVRRMIEPCQVVYLQELCEAAGIVIVKDEGWHLFGRRLTLNTVAKAFEDGALDGRVCLRAFRSEMNAPQSSETERRLLYCRSKMVPKIKLAHRVAEYYPQLRDWDDTEAEIVLYREANPFKCVGVIFA